MIKVISDKERKDRVLIEVDATSEELMVEFSVLLSEMRKKHKDIYF